MIDFLRASNLWASWNALIESWEMGYSLVGQYRIIAMFLALMFGSAIDVAAQSLPSAGAPGQGHTSPAIRQTLTAGEPSKSATTKTGMSRGRRHNDESRPVQQASVQGSANSNPQTSPDITDTTFATRPELANLQALETCPIDLVGVFALIGVQNPQFLAAENRVLEATATRQLAAVQLLPTINLGSSVDSHQGVLQQSDGNILSVRRDALFVGAGASAIAAGTVNIPGVVWNLNISESIYNYLMSRQVQAQRAANVTTVNNDVQLRVAVAYLELVRAASQRSVCWQARDEVEEVAKSTANFARVGQGRTAVANRAASELSRRDADIIEAEGQIVRASARLASLVGLDTAIRLVPIDRWAVPHSIVPEPIPLPELLAIASLQRPELVEQRAEIARTMLALDSAEMLPFSPNVFIGFSTGAFGGGSNLASDPVGSNQFARGQDRFGSFQSRADFDVILYWTIRNLGVGNRAQIEASDSRARQSQLQELILFDRIRSEVAAASVRVHARFHQLKTAETAVREAEQGWQQDRKRMWANEGLPIEVLDSQRLLFRSRLALLNTIILYNIAQFELYQSLGHPQSELLVRTADPAPDIDVLMPSPQER